MSDRAAQQASALAALERIVAAGGDADDVLRGAIAALHEHVPDYTWVALRFSEAGDLVLGPTAGEEQDAVLAKPVVYNGERVGQLEVAASSLQGADRAFLERVADLIALHTLLGWDTGGDPWEP
jgi:putative methionine-R-sulfoxide reductase with GAF domain